MANKNCSLKSHQYILNLFYSKTVTRENPRFFSHSSKQNGNTVRLESSLSSLKIRKLKSCLVKTLWSPPESPSQLNSVYLWEEAKRLINDFQETGNWKDEFSILSTKQDSPLLPHHTTSSLFPLAQLSPPALWETFLTLASHLNYERFTQLILLPLVHHLPNPTSENPIHTTFIVL